jgi:hypothetical protein
LGKIGHRRFFPVFSSEQSIIRLVLVNRAIRVRMALNEAEAFDLKGAGTEIGVFGQKRSEAAASLQMRQFDMRDIGPGLGRQSDLLEPVFYPVLQACQRRVLLDADPQRMSAKKWPTPASDSRKADASICSKAAVISDCRRIVDCTDKAKRKNGICQVGPTSKRRGTAGSPATELAAFSLAAVPEGPPPFAGT